MDNLWVEDFINIPYKSLGRDFNGVDCWGLTYLIYKEKFNILLPKIDEGYLNGLNCEEVAPLFQDNLKLFLNSDTVIEIKSPPKPFDMVLFRRSGFISHIGTIINNNMFIHADLGSASCLERLNHNYWKNRIVGIYRYVRN